MVNGNTASARRHSRAEILSDAVIHGLGLGAVAVAVPALFILAAQWRGDTPAMASAAIYGMSLLAMIGCSALYHMLPHTSWRPFLRQLDHSAIYFKIAGTYTPFTLLSGGHGVALLGGLWGAALAGSSLRFLAADRFRWVGFALYLGMGWAGVLAGWPLFAELSAPVLSLVVAGGLIYTAGTVFFLWEMLPFNNTIWHGFVLVATILLYSAVVLHMADTAQPGLAAANV